MAHLGRRYPVYFRRDFNRDSNINEQYALPAAWRVVPFGFGPGAPIPAGHVFICDTSTMPSVSAIEWSSAPQSIAGALWILVVSAFFTAVPDTFLWGKFYLYRNGILAARWTVSQPDRAGPFVPKPTVPPVMEYWNPAIYTAPPGFEFSAWNTVGY